MDEQYILSKIQQLMPDEHHVPRGVLYTQLKTAVQKDVSLILSNLFQSGKITYSKTINDILIKIEQ